MLKRVNQYLKILLIIIKLGEKMVSKDKKIKKYLKIIGQIEKTRSVNNVNWMNILRIAIKKSPEQTIEVMKKINTRDEKIADLFKKLSNEE